MKSWKIPTPEQVEKAITQLGKPELFRYFFDRLENPNWVKPLWEKGFFKNPPKIIRNEENNLVQTPLWSESKYLARMASKNPKDVFEVIIALPETENFLVLEDIIDAALALPPELAAKISEKIIASKEIFNEFLAIKIGNLISHLAKGGQIKWAFRIAKVLLDLTSHTITEEYFEGQKKIPRFSEPRSIIDEWTYREILNKNYPDLIKRTGIQAIEFLCEILNKALAIRHSHANEDKGRDYSYIWRKSVDDHESSVGQNDIKYNLVTAITIASEQIIENDPNQIPGLIDVLEKYKFDIFSRIALHILTLSLREHVKYVYKYLAGRDLINNYSCRREYFLLLEKRFSYLHEEKQKMIYSMIEGGPNKLPDETDSEYETHKKYWQRNLLWNIRSHLTGEQKSYFDSLIKELGEPNFEEFSDQGAVWVGPTSPKSLEELKSYSIYELITFLKSWHFKEEWRAPSPEGLGRNLTSVVSQGPESYAVNAELFKELEPTYIRALINGFCEALKKERIFNWQPVLNLSLWIANQNREIPDKKKRKQFDEDIDWGNARTSIIRLLIVGLDKDNGGISFADREIVLKILQLLTEDPDPTPIDEKKYLETNGPLDIAINSPRGNAIEAVIKYSLWVKKNLDKDNDNDKDIKDSGFEIMPEVREILETHLDMNKDPSLAIRSIYGLYFPWIHLLDRGWTIKHLDKIFPGESDNHLCWEAAWGSFINYNEPYNDVFETLLPKYELAVKRLGLSSKINEHNQGWEERLAEHLIIYYFRGKFDLGDASNPFAIFWEKASIELKLHALSFMGRILFDTKETIEPEILNRIKKLWDWRLEQMRKDSSYSDFSELSSFGWWFSSGKFESKWAISMLKDALQKAGKIKTSHNVIERLSKIELNYLKEAIGCLDMIIKSDKDGWKIYGWREEAKSLLRRGLQSKESKSLATATIHKLGDMGYFDFGELLK